MKQTAEHQRLNKHHAGDTSWRHWGPYLSERAWGTVREDYSSEGNAWQYFPHDHARSRAYRWNEDGLAGISDHRQYLCFALALWNGHDPILKERLFGLTGVEGNHGEDVKEVYFYLDNTPTHSYMKMLYKYPHNEFPYQKLIEENAKRGFRDFEYELQDTGVFEENRYFDVFVAYAKADTDDILIEIEIVNRGPETASYHILPTLWFRNTWQWGYEHGPMGDVSGKALLKAQPALDNSLVLLGTHPTLEPYFLYAEEADSWLFTENETNNERLFGGENNSPYVKDAFHRAIVDGDLSAVNPTQEGTKACAVYAGVLGAGESRAVRLRLSCLPQAAPFDEFEAILIKRRDEADEFYANIHKATLSDQEKSIQRQAFAGMLWSKQLYYYDVEQWLDGDPAFPKPPNTRIRGRNHHWRHLNNFDILSMPDKWEYPWYAVWDLAFHTIPLVQIDPEFAKYQVSLFTREWYMHPNGQLPAYEWSFSDANPPVHAWAAWRVYKIDGKHNAGKHDKAFLEGVFHKMLMNFTWWVNRKDAEGDNIFQGGFLGLDNISIFDRSSTLPLGGQIDQSDGTAWMGFYALEMLKISLELAETNPVYQDLATKFYEHFLAIAVAMTDHFRGQSLWDDEDGFFYDVMKLPDGHIIPLKVRSMVGLMPLLAVETLEESVLARMSEFKTRMDWVTHNKPHLSSSNMASVYVPGAGERRILSIVSRERLERVLKVMLDENEFLSPYGIRSLSKWHDTHPFRLQLDGQTLSIDYEPAESETGMFGGNSNWRGPIWFPINYLLIESLQKFHHYYGDDLKVEMPTGSEHWVTLEEVALDLSRRLIKLFERDTEGRRPSNGYNNLFQDDPHWREYVQFFEYFHGDNGAGLGASHQTGWTGLVAKLIDQAGG